MAAAYDLEDGARLVVTGSGETTNKVQSIVEDAGARRAELVEEHAAGAFEQAAATQTDGSDPSDQSGLVSEPDDAGDESATDDGAETDDGTDADDADEDQSGLTDFM